MYVYFAKLAQFDTFVQINFVSFVDSVCARYNLDYLDLTRPPTHNLLHQHHRHYTQVCVFELNLTCCFFSSCFGWHLLVGVFTHSQALTSLPFQKRFFTHALPVSSSPFAGSDVDRVAIFRHSICRFEVEKRKNFERYEGKVNEPWPPPASLPQPALHFFFPPGTRQRQHQLLLFIPILIPHFGIISPLF